MCPGVCSGNLKRVQFAQHSLGPYRAVGYLQTEKLPRCTLYNIQGQAVALPNVRHWKTRRIPPPLVRDLGQYKALLYRNRGLFKGTIEHGARE